MGDSRLKLGTAPNSWGIWFPDDPRQMPWERCLDEISAVGYEWIELGPYGYLPTDTEILRKELADRGLRVSGTFTMGFLTIRIIGQPWKRRPSVPANPWSRSGPGT